MSFDKLIDGILSSASAGCGKGFNTRVATVLKSNEAALKESWKNIPPKDLTSTDRHNLTLDFKFEVIRGVVSEYLTGNDYDSFLVTVGELCIKSLEFERGVTVLNEVKSRKVTKTNKEIIGTARRALGEVYAKQAEWESALTEFKAAYKLLKDSADTAALALTQNTLGILYAETGKFKLALESFRGAKRYATRNGDRELLLKVFMNLGNIHNIRGEHTKAIESYQAALKSLGRVVNDPLRALIHHNLGIAYKNLGRLGAAEKKLEEGLKYSERAGDERIAGLSYLERAEIMHRKGEIDNSVVSATRAFKIFSNINDRLGVAEVYKLMGMNYVSYGNYDLAEVYLGNSLRINERHDNALNMGETYIEIARLQKEKNDTDAAMNAYTKAVSCFTTLEAKTKISEVTKEMDAVNA